MKPWFFQQTFVINERMTSRVSLLIVGCCWTITLCLLRTFCYIIEIVFITCPVENYALFWGLIINKTISITSTVRLMKPEGEIVWQVLRRVHYRLLNSGCCWHCSFQLFLWLKLGWRTYFSRFAVKAVKVEGHQWIHSRPSPSFHSFCWNSCLQETRKNHSRVPQIKKHCWAVHKSSSLFFANITHTQEAVLMIVVIFLSDMSFERGCGWWRNIFFQCNGWLCQILPPLNEAEWWHPLHWKVMPNSFKKR